MKTVVLLALVLVTFCNLIIEWKDCPPPQYARRIESQPLFSGRHGGTIHGLHDLPEKCASILVPSNWEDLNSTKLIYFVRKLVARQPSSGHFWMLEGGPGASGDGLLNQAAEVYKQFNGSLNIYFPDHRGTGYSSPLFCTEMNNPEFRREFPPGILWKRCIDDLKLRRQGTLNQYTVTNAARDLGNVIRSVSSPGDKIYMYGVSYGTYLLHRYLQLFPSQPTLSVFDGMAPPIWTQESMYDKDANDVGIKLVADYCQKNVFCRSKLIRPLLSLQQVYNHVQSQKFCPQVYQKLNQKLVASRMFRVLQTSPAVIAPLLYRLNRCNSLDQKLLKHFFEGPKHAKQDYLENSELLYSHIVLSEYFYNSTLPSIQEIELIQTNSYFSSSSSIFLRHLYDQWPKYNQDQYNRRFIDINSPFLVINGDLDAQTPQYLAKYFFDNTKRSRHQYYVPFPNGGHGLFFSSKCAQHIIYNFVKDPSRIHSKCIGEISPLDWEGKQVETSKSCLKMFGNSNCWLETTQTESTNQK